MIEKATTVAEALKRAEGELASLRVLVARVVDGLSAWRILCAGLDVGELVGAAPLSILVLATDSLLNSTAEDLKTVVEDMRAVRAAFEAFDAAPTPCVVDNECYHDCVEASQERQVKAEAQARDARGAAERLRRVGL